MAATTPWTVAQWDCSPGVFGELGRLKGVQYRNGATGPQQDGGAHGGLVIFMDTTGYGHETWDSTLEQPHTLTIELEGTPNWLHGDTVAIREDKEAKRAMWVAYFLGLCRNVAEPEGLTIKNQNRNNGAGTL